MNNYKGQRENFTGSVGLQHVTEIVDVFQLLFSRELINKIIEETNRYAEQFLHRYKLSSRSTARTWKPVAERGIYVVLGRFTLTGIVQKITLRSYFITKRLISTPEFGDIITRGRLELICKLLHFANSETIITNQP
jgi:hypothetical protein